MKARLPDAPCTAPARLSVVLALVVGMTGCGREPAASTSVKTVPKTAPVTEARPQAAPTPPAESAQAAEEKEHNEELDRLVGAYKREHPFQNAKELLQQEAFLKLLAPVLQDAAKNHQFGERVQQAVDFAATVKDGTAKPGSFRLDLQVDNYTPERTDRMLGAVLSKDPEKLVKYVTNEVTEAAVEINYAGNRDRTTNGVSIVPNPPPEPPK